MNLAIISLFFFITCFNQITLAQESVDSCKVLSKSINLEYRGPCKKGLANGIGEAKGIHQYKGNFKNGYPNGNGIYYYSDNMYFDGNFQNGIKEGKGEMHYKKNEQPDSIVKGYWSADVYRGKNYVTYTTDAVAKFDQVDISPSSQSGNKVTIEISNTSKSLDGKIYNSRGLDIYLTELVSMKSNSLLKLLSTNDSQLKSIWVFEVTEFPIQLRGVLSNGQNFNLELYKCADWLVRLFMNK